MDEKTTERLVEVMVRLGFTTAEASAYRRLIAPAVISDNAAIGTDSPPDTVLVALEKAGLVARETSDAGAPWFEVVDPRIASRALYARFLWSHCPSEGHIIGLSDDVRTTLVRHREDCSRFEALALPFVAVSGRSDSLEMIAGESISESIAVSLAQTQRTIRGITLPSWAPHTSVVWETIRSRLRAGVSYLRLADEWTLIGFGHAINKRDVLEAGVNLRLHRREQFAEKYFICDDRVAIIFWPADPSSSFPLEATRTMMPAFIGRCTEAFDGIWNRAVSATDLFPHIEELRCRYIASVLSALGDTCAAAAATLFDYGKFCYRADGSPQYGIGAESLRELRAKGFVVPLPTEEWALVPNVVDTVRSLLPSASEV